MLPPQNRFRERGHRQAVFILLLLSGPTRNTALEAQTVPVARRASHKIPRNPLESDRKTRQEGRSHADGGANLHGKQAAHLAECRSQGISRAVDQIPAPGRGKEQPQDSEDKEADSSVEECTGSSKLAARATDHGPESAARAARIAREPPTVRPSG